MLNVHELNVFVEAAQVENFSIAAQRLYLSQPAVSLQIRNLEKQLGIDLFNRNGRNVTLSDAGKALLPLAQELLHESRHIEEVMWGLQGVVIGDLMVACSTTIGKYILPRLIASYTKEYPQVQVTINVMGRRAALDCLLDGQADVAVASKETPHRDLEYAPFLEDRVVLIVPAGHPWADGRELMPADLPGLPLIMREPTAGAYEVLLEGLAQHGLSVGDLKVVMTLGNAEAIEMSVEAGIGGAFVSRLAAARGLSLGCVAEVPVRGLDLRRTIYIARHIHRQAAPPGKTFWDFVFRPANANVRELQLTM